MRTANLAFAGATALVVAVFFVFTSLKSESNNEPIKQRKSDQSFDFVRSFEGTTRDGNISQSDMSQLQVSAELRLLFDYYLAATGEKKLPEIRAEIEKVLDQKLSGNAALQAKNLLARYIQYKEALVSVEANAQNISAGKTSMASAARQRWSAMQQTRQRFFSEKENQAMFGFDDAYDIDALNRLDVAENASLTTEQKQAQLKALDDALPAALREEKMPLTRSYALKNRPPICVPQAPVKKTSIKCAPPPLHQKPPADSPKSIEKKASGKPAYNNTWSKRIN